MKLLESIADALDRICGAIIVVMVGLMVIFTTAQIICRTWFTSLTWAEEACRFLLIWASFLGATCVYRHSGNIAVTFVQDLFPAPVRRWIRILVHAVCLVLFAVLFYYGLQYCGKQVRNAAAIPIKMKYVYMCLPISMVIMAYQALVLMLREFRGEEVKA